jgi:hypothetical protein
MNERRADVILFLETQVLEFNKIMVGKKTLVANDEYGIFRIIDKTKRPTELWDDSFSFI